MLSPAPPCHAHPAPAAAGGPQHLPGAGYQPAGAVGHARPARRGAGAARGAAGRAFASAEMQRSAARSSPTALLGAPTSGAVGAGCGGCASEEIGRGSPWMRAARRAYVAPLTPARSPTAPQEMASPIVSYVGGKDYARGTKFSCMATSGEAGQGLGGGKAGWQSTLGGEPKSSGARPLWAPSSCSSALCSMCSQKQALAASEQVRDSR